MNLTRALMACLFLGGIPVAFLPAAENEDKEKGQDKSLLTLKRIYQSGEFGSSSYGGRWMDQEDGSVYTRWKSSETVSGGRDLLAYDPETDESSVLIPAEDFVPPGETQPLSVSGLTWSKDKSKVLVFTNTKRVWRAHTRGDYWVLDRSSHELFKLGGDAPDSTLMFAKFSPPGDKVAYVRANNIYVQDLHSHEVKAVTTDGTEDIINGTFDWVYEEEFRLRDGFRWSPDGKTIAYWQLDTRGERKFPLINNTDSLYPTIQWIQYPKVGEVNAATRIGVVQLADMNTLWLDVPGDPRQHYLHYLEWPEASGQIVLQQLNRLQNTNRYMTADPETGQVRTFLTDKDDAWVDHHARLHYLEADDPDDVSFIWFSDMDGWKHLYRSKLDGSKTDLVTQGDFDVVSLLHVDEKDGWVYFSASPEDPTQRYLFRGRVGKKKVERITPEDAPGSHSYRISPDGQWAFHTYSRFAEPPVTELVRLPSHETVRVYEDNESLRKKLETLKPVKTDMFRVDIGSGIILDGYCILPGDLDRFKKEAYPLLIYVYGEPAGQTVRDRWGGRGYLWHMMLAQQGYVVMSFDNRGTPAPRGRDWRKSVYRKIGIVSPTDQAKAVEQVLKDRTYLDPKRVGIWGWSGGGSSTLQALFKYPDLYSMGIAIAAVPNQRYYDTIYQERYMGLPKDNVEGFRQGSPINFAQNLKGKLLLIHGTGDDNVHYQGMEALINTLVRHGKQFDMMAYPNRSHSISERSGTTMHLRTLMLNYIHRYLPLD